MVDIMFRRAWLDPTQPKMRGGGRAWLISSGDKDYGGYPPDGLAGHVWVGLGWVSKKYEKIKCAELNLLPFGVIENSWDALRLGIQPFLCFDRKNLIFFPWNPDKTRIRPYGARILVRSARFTPFGST